MPKPRPTPAQLFERAAQLRKDAAVLDHAHERQVRPLDAEFTKSDGPWAAAQGTLASARSAAAVKGREAQELRAKAQKTDESAPATELRARADQLDLIARLDLRTAQQEVARLERAHTERRAPFDKLEEAGDQLESRAAALEEAAQALRSASRATPAERRKLIEQAEQAIERSDAAPPVDLSHIDAQVLIDATKALPTLPKTSLLDDVDPVDPVDPMGATEVASIAEDPVLGLVTQPLTDEGLADPLEESAPVTSDGDPVALGPSEPTVADFGPIVAAIDPLDEPAVDFPDDEPAVALSFDTEI